jgi:transposase
MLAIHPKARTTPAVRAEIARSHESSGVLAQRYGVSTETIRKGRKRGPADGQDRSARPHKLPWKASEEERALVRALRRATGFPLDDLTFVVTHVLPHLNRDAVYRILKAEGLGRLPQELGELRTMNVHVNLIPGLAAGVGQGATGLVWRALHPA